jgi:hypothetical protein
MIAIAGSRSTQRVRTSKMTDIRFTNGGFSFPAPVLDVGLDEELLNRLRAADPQCLLWRILLATACWAYERRRDQAQKRADDPGSQELLKAYATIIHDVEADMAGTGEGASEADALVRAILENGSEAAAARAVKAAKVEEARALVKSLPRTLGDKLRALADGGNDRARTLLGELDHETLREHDGMPF